MIMGWLGRCNLRAIEVKQYGYIPHSRLFKTLRVFESKEVIIFNLDAWGYRHRLEYKGTSILKETTRLLFSQIEEAGVVTNEWTCFQIDRKKIPTIIFAFKDVSDAVRARLVLEN